MSVFRFKKFEVVNERSAMKVNTDGVLLGAAMTIKPHDRRLLDVGTGTGTIALMAAQRLFQMQAYDGEEAALCSDLLSVSDSVSGIGSGATHTESEPCDCSETDFAGTSEAGAGDASLRISAIDIDEISVTEAQMNFRNSPWSSCLTACHLSLDEFNGNDIGEFDLIFSNPPYFESSLLAPQQRRSNARHTTTGLSYRELLEFASERLAPEGRISMVLPAEQENDLCRHARMCGLHLFRIVRVRTVPRKAPGRMIAEFSRLRCDAPQECLITIQNEGKYTEEYLSLTHDFYLFA